MLSSVRESSLMERMFFIGQGEMTASMWMLMTSTFLAFYTKQKCLELIFQYIYIYSTSKTIISFRKQKKTRQMSTHHCLTILVFKDKNE